MSISVLIDFSDDFREKVDVIDTFRPKEVDEVGFVV